MNLKRYRKTLAAAGLGVVELAAYVAADPRNLPSWVVTGALAVNALAVYFVRNQPPPQVAPTLFARRPAPDPDDYRTHPDPPGPSHGISTYRPARDADPPRPLE